MVTMDFEHIFIGSASGGLYVVDFSNGNTSGNYLPCSIDGKEIVLPVSSLLKINDSIILVGTGEGMYPKGNRQNKFASQGRGLFLFNTLTKEFVQLPNTNPGMDLDADFASVNGLDMMIADGVMYIYAATSKGLFRWVASQYSDLYTVAPQKVFDGTVREIKISQQYNRAFFSSKGYLWKISDVINSLAPVNISGTCSAFGSSASGILIAIAPSDETFVYAAPVDADGLLKGVYLTRNTNTWTLVSTSTVTPFTSVATAKTCGALVVDPADPKVVYIGGANIWKGQGYGAYDEISTYQWTLASYNENQLNGGDYMAQVFSNRNFVHSGIHQMVVTRWGTSYIMTDAGAFYSPSNMATFENVSRGINCTQLNSLAVLPDGSLISGANSNGSPFIESRMAHNGGVSDTTWYDPTATFTNHSANVLFYGNGGGVAASRFTQYAPQSRRPLFVSAAGGVIGRGYDDFSNYTVTQTWTYGEAFMSDQVAGGPAVGQLSLWETKNNISRDSIVFTIDTLAYLHRNGTLHQMRHDFQVEAGDSIVVLDIAHAYYPFWYVFDHSFKVKDELRHTVHAPYASRLLAITVENDMPKNTDVSLCWFPTDFRQVFDNSNDTRFWSHIYAINGDLNPHYVCRQAVMSNDGNTVFVVVENDSTNTSFVARVKGFNNVNYFQSVHEVRDAMKYNVTGRVTTTDTLRFADDSYTFSRRISSIAIDPRDGKDNIVITFDGFGNNAPNVVYVENASSASPVFTNITVDAANSPAYSALVEYTTGRAFVGTENGVFTTDNIKTGAWEEFGNFAGVPVTAICQQTATDTVFHYLGHDGVTDVNYIFPRTKWPYAIYFGTYGRGIFMDSTFVQDHTNEVLSPEDVLSIPTVVATGANALHIYPNPAVDRVTLDLTVAKAGPTLVNIYDINGKLVISQSLGRLAEGNHSHTIDCSRLSHGMYLVNVLVGSDKATSKLIVR